MTPAKLQGALNDVLLIWPTNGPGARRALRSLVLNLKDEYGLGQWRSPSGRSYKNIQLPPELLTVTSGPKDSGIVVSNAYNLLDMTVLFRAPASLFVLLVASGFDPCLFCEDLKSTPLGAAAIAGQKDVIRHLRRMGIDMNLRILPCHYEKDPNLSPNLLGTNLLHRLANRHDREEHHAVVKELLLAGVDPMEQDAKGRTPIDIARPGCSHIMRQWVAARCLKELEQEVPRSRTVAAGHRL